MTYMRQEDMVPPIDTHARESLRAPLPTNRFLVGAGLRIGALSLALIMLIVASF